MTKIKDALAKWEAINAMSASESKEVKLCGLIPPIEKMDASLGQLVSCEKLSLSTNAIDKISNLGNLKHLKILSLGRNNIKAFAGLEAVADTLEELWISYCQIEKTKGIGVLRKLKVLYMACNNVKDMAELSKLAELPNLEELVFVGNPLEETLTAQETYRETLTKLLPNLRKLDGFVVLRD